MQFGYFTLSDNAYPNNPRSAEQLILEICDQALYAEELGMHSVWIGEHHFDSLGVNSRPGTVLSHIAAQTKHVRLAPAVTVLPLHHPIHVAEEWATLDLLSGGRVDFATGRGYDRREFAPFAAPFMQSAEIFEEGIDVLLQAWNSPGRWSHKGAFFDIQDMQITPLPVQKPLPFYVASFSELSAELAAKRGLNIIYAPFAAAMVYGDLTAAVTSYREKCAAHDSRPGKAKCSYFIHIADNDKEEAEGREAQLAYFKHCVLPAFPKDLSKAPPTMHYFKDIVHILENMKMEDLGDKSILIGGPQRIIDVLKRVEASGIDEVILYFNVGNKPHNLVRDQMARFMTEIAPHFT